MAWSAEARLDSIAQRLGDVADLCDDVFNAELGEDVLEVRHALMRAIARHRGRRAGAYSEARLELEAD